MKLSGARILLECLKKEGVDLIFGLPGGAVLPIYDVLYDFQGIRHILVRQEAAAGHAAEGYARTTGKVGVCLVTSGPGATNLVTALQDALDGLDPDRRVHRAGADAPASATTRSRKRTMSGSRARRPSTTSWSRTARTWRTSSRRRSTSPRPGRPGPGPRRPAQGHPRQGVADFEYPSDVHLRPTARRTTGTAARSRRPRGPCARAKRPVLYVGGGAISSDASPELVELAELTQIPVTLTLHGPGRVPDRRIRCPWTCWACTATYYANNAVQRVGSADRRRRALRRPRHRQGRRVLAKHAKIIHIDIDPSSISKNIKVHIPIVGDCKRVLREAAATPSATSSTEGVPAAVLEAAQAVGRADRRVAARRTRCATTGTTTSSSRSTSSRRSRNLTQRARRSSSPAWASTRCGPPSTTASSTRGTWFTSGGLGTMGFGLPAAMGVQAAQSRQDRDRHRRRRVAS